MTNTTNYNLKKPDLSDRAQIGDINDNMDTIDAALAAKQDKIDSSHPIDGTEVKLGTYSVPSNKSDVAVNDDMKTAIGKVEKKANLNETNISKDDAALVELVDSGAKNIFPVRFTSKAATASNPSCTNNGDGTVTLNGSRVGNDSIIVYDLSSDLPSSTDTRYTLPAGKYVVSGSTDSNARIQVYCHDGTNLQALATSMNSSVEFNYTSDLKATYPYIAWRLLVKSSSTFSNVKLYPMICTKAAWGISQAYVPYRPPYQELYERVVALEQANQ